MADDTVKRIILKFEVQAGKLNDELDKIKKKGEESKGWFSGFKELNEHVNDGVEKLANLTLAFEGIKKVAEFTFEAIRERAKDMRLEMSTAGVSIDALKESVHGLLDEDTLRESAAKLIHGALRPTQEQMQTMGEAAVALRDTMGVDLKQAMDTLTDAMVTGRTRGLHEFGIEVQEGASKFETLKNIMGELNKKIAESHGPASTAADDLDRLTVKYKELDKEAKAFWADAAQALVAESLIMKPELLKAQALKDQWQQFNQMFGSDYRSYLSTLHANAAGFVAGKNEVAQSQNIDFDEGWKFNTALGQKHAAEASQASALATLHGATYGEDRNVNPSFGGGLSLGAASSIGYDEKGLQNLIEFNAQQQQGRELTAQWMAESQRYSKEKTFLQTLGLDKPDAMDVAITGLKKFSEAWQMSLKAIADGSLSAAQIFKKGLAMILAGLGDKFAAMSASYMVESMIALYEENYILAGQKAAAGAAAGAGAVALYVAANKLSPGTASGNANSRDMSTATGSGNSRTGSSYRGGNSYGSTGGPQTQSTIIVIGETFADMNPRERARNAREYMKAGGMNTGVEDS